MDSEEITSHSTDDKMIVDKTSDASMALEETILNETTERVQNEKSGSIDAANYDSTSSTNVLAKQDEPAPPPVPPPSVAIETNTENETTAEDDHPEWEVDSSPIESSSDDSSDDSSSEDSDEDGENSYKLLSPEEQARILMLGDGASDDEEGGNKGGKGSSSHLRTKNEIPEEVIPKPDVTITPDMPIEELGGIEAVVENTLLIKAKTSGEYRVLESGSVLCLGDRSVIGVVSETLGRVQQPLYSVRFTNATEIAEAGLVVGTKVFYSEQHSTYVFTQALKTFKGSDASNMHDEEVGEEEVEFSDDEAEMEHRRKLKQRRVEKRGGKMQQSGGPNRGAHPLQQGQTASRGAGALNYDDAEDDGPYKPLTRPSGFADTVGRGEAPLEPTYLGGADRTNYGNRNGDHFRGRSRGDKGRGRGDRGRGRGGFYDRRGDGSGYSLPPQDYQNGNYAQSPPAFSQPPMPSPPAGYPLPQGPSPNFNNASPNEYSPQQPLLWQHMPHQTQYQRPYQQAFPNMPESGWQNMSQSASLPSGAFINPAFFPVAQSVPTVPWTQQGQQQQQQSQSPYPPGNPGPGK